MASRVGLLAFLISVGAQITRLESGRAPTASIVGSLLFDVEGQGAVDAPATPPIQ